MTAASPFGLYPSRGCVAGQRLAANHALLLGTPVVEGGVTLFRQPLWLAVPAAVRGSTLLALAASALKVRFAPTTLEVPTDDRAWFSRVDTKADHRTARLEFTWPASVSRLADPFGYHDEPFKLYRVDGERVADEATMTGATAGTLSPPWIGSPLQVVMDRALPPLLDIVAGLATTTVGFSSAAPVGVRAAPGVGAGSPGGVGIVEAGQAARRVGPRRSHLVPTVSISGVPTSPRLKLVLEARAGQPETLLWQALLPGEQGTVSLPAGAVAEEWAPALEQVRQRLADEAPPLAAPLLLRLDIESDAPCAVTLTALVLALDEERELLAEETRLDFDGTREQSKAVALAWPGGTLQSLSLQGRVGGGTDAPAAAGPLPAGLRRGLLLQAALRARVHAVLEAPARVAGLAIAWHPLSDVLVLTLRLLADAGSAPIALPLLERKLELDTPSPGWLALRAPPLDLQAQPLWIELGVDEGSGLWLAADDAPAPTQGWTEVLDATPPLRLPLGAAPRHAWLPAPTAADQPRQAALRSGPQVLAASLDEHFELSCPGALLATLPSQGLQVHSASATRVTLQSARARLRVG